MLDLVVGFFLGSSLGAFFWCSTNDLSSRGLDTINFFFSLPFAKYMAQEMPSLPHQYVAMNLLLVSEVLFIWLTKRWHQNILTFFYSVQCKLGSSTCQISVLLK